MAYNSLWEFLVLLLMPSSQPIDPLWLANSKFRRGKLAECIEICNSLLATNPGDLVRSIYITETTELNDDNFLW